MDLFVFFISCITVAFTAEPGDCTTVSFSDTTHVGTESFSGMDPGGYYTSTPNPFVVSSSLTITSKVHKEDDCSDHLFWITDSDSYGSWTLNGRPGHIKIMWDCDLLTMTSPDHTPFTRESYRLAEEVVHTLTIVYSTTKVTVTTDTGAFLEVSGSFWSEVWLWIGADDDSRQESDFSDVSVSYPCDMYECDWVPVTTCPCTDSDPAGCDIPQCHNIMNNGELCEADGFLPFGAYAAGGLNYNINNCPGGYDVFEFKCVENEPSAIPSVQPTTEPTHNFGSDICGIPEGEYIHLCSNCNVDNCIMTCECGFGITSIDLASRCSGEHLKVMGGALVCPSHDETIDLYDAAVVSGDIGEMLALQNKCVDEGVLEGDIISASCLKKSRTIFQPTSEETESVFNGLIWSFGQFVDHDLDLISEEDELVVHVEVPNEGNFEFHASKSSCDDGKFGKRVNEITSLLDLSSVYNDSCPLKYDPVNRAKLRADDALLPRCAVNNEMGLSCAAGQFICGDVRCNENPFLMAQHHLWAFHHNHIVDEITTLMPGATDEELYHTAKHINIVTYQKIIFDEFLPALVGQLTSEEATHSNLINSKKLLHDYRCKDGFWLDLQEKKVTSELCIEILSSLEDCSDTYMSYSIEKGCFCVPKESTCSYKIRESQVQTYEIDVRAKTDVSISPLFAGAAYRLHHLVNDEFELASGMTDTLQNHFFQPSSFIDNGKTDHWVNQLLKQKAHQFGAHMSNSLQHALFGIPGQDLAARNCMRGRDLDLPTYNEARELMGLPARTDFSWSTCAELSELYDNDVDAIELFIGGSCESPVPGAVLGETFRAIVKDQFLRLRDGDPNYNVPHLFGHKYRTFAEVLGEVTGVDLSDLDFDNVFMYQAPSM